MKHKTQVFVEHEGAGLEAAAVDQLGFVIEEFLDVATQCIVGIVAPNPRALEISVHIHFLHNQARFGSGADDP